MSGWPGRAAYQRVSLQPMFQPLFQLLLPCLEVLQLLALGLLDLQRNLAASVQEVRNLLEVRGAAATGGHGLKNCSAKWRFWKMQEDAVPENMSLKRVIWLGEGHLMLWFLRTSPLQQQRRMLCLPTGAPTRTPPGLRADTSPCTACGKNWVKQIETPNGIEKSLNSPWNDLFQHVHYSILVHFIDVFYWFPHVFLLGVHIHVMYDYVYYLLVWWWKDSNIRSG